MSKTTKPKTPNPDLSSISIQNLRREFLLEITKEEKNRREALDALVVLIKVYRRFFLYCIHVYCDFCLLFYENNLKIMLGFGESKV